jgi:hypothetical protein
MSTTHTHRGHTIIKHESNFGGRNHGEIFYETTDGRFGHHTLKAIKAQIDFALDNNPQETDALRQRIIASLTKG